MFLPLFYNGAWYQYSKMNALFWKKTQHFILHRAKQYNTIAHFTTDLILSQYFYCRHFFFQIEFILLNMRFLKFILYI